MASRINVFRQKVAAGQYELTEHAKREMEQDGFSIDDVKFAIYTGKIVATQRHGQGRRKDIVEGKAIDERKVRLVCRLTDLGCLRIITIFSVE